MEAQSLEGLLEAVEENSGDTTETEENSGGTTKYVVDGISVEVKWDPRIVQDLIKDELAKWHDIRDKEIAGLPEKVCAELNEYALKYERDFADSTNERRQKLLKTQQKNYSKLGLKSPEIQYFYQALSAEEDMKMWQSGKELPPQDKYTLRNFREELGRKFEEFNPKLTEEEIEKEIQRICPLYKTGDMVTITVQHKKITGKLKSVNSTRVFIGLLNIKRCDMPREIECMFDEEMNAGYQAELRESLVQKHETERDKFVALWERFLFRDYMYFKGYVSDRYVSDTLERGDATELHWISRKEFCARLVERRAEELKENYEEFIYRKVAKDLKNARKNELYHEDFEWVEALEEWMPVSVVADIKSQVAAARERERLARIELAKAQARERAALAEQRAAEARLAAQREAAEYERLGDTFSETDVWNFIDCEVLPCMQLGEFPTEQWEKPWNSERITGLRNWSKVRVGAVGKGMMRGKEVRVVVDVGGVRHMGRNYNNLIFTVIRRNGVFKVRDMRLD